MILVIGDVMLDKYTFGKIERINPEAPVPILHVNKEEYRLGGAANTANNISALGEKVILIGLTNKDNSGEMFNKLCKNNNIEYYSFCDERPTIVKQRFIAKMYNQQVLRVDYENGKLVSQDISDNIIKLILEKNPNIIVISDYAKGIITEYFMTKLKKEFSGKILADTKPKNVNFIKDIFLLKPNIKEAKEILKTEYISDSNTAAEEISEKFNCNVVITMGKEGSVLYDKNTKEIFSVKSVAKDVYDVSGAGDTFIATLAYAINKDYSLKNALKLANKAASIVVGKLGTATISYDELFNN